MPKMDKDALLKHLQAHEDDASQYVEQIGKARLASLREYNREAYPGDEDMEGWSRIVTSEVQDTVEWILPELLDVFTSTDEAVVFEPVTPEDVQGAQQATDTCNYVFYKQNNGFLELYTAIKDALTVQNCAVMWRKEKYQARTTEQAQGLSAEMLALAEEQGFEIEAATPRQVPVTGLDGQPLVDPLTGPVLETVYDVNLARTDEKTRIRVEAFPPEQLLVKRDWTSPLLAECPYVCRTLEVTLSDLHQMGFPKVEASDLRTSAEPGASSLENDYRKERLGVDSADANQDLDLEDESQATGWLRIEYVLVDTDGDGIAERRCIYRLETKILSNEECSHVQIATASPILNPHRWNGMSVAEMVSDLQRLKTDLTRNMVNAANLAVNPRKTVLTDQNGAPFVEMDDLLDFRIGGIIRQKRENALGAEPTPFNGAQMLPVLSYVDDMAAKRTGVSDQQQGLDPNALRPDRTAAEVMMTANAAKQRVKLIARVFAEVLLKPIFQGILKLLTDGEMEPIAFRLRGQFVQYDPNEWRDQYDMTINVGLGTGDKQQQIAFFQQLFQMQMGLSQTPYSQLMIQPQNIYNTAAKIVELMGQKNVGDFIGDPKGKALPPSPPPPQLQLEQAKMQMQGQMKQAELQQSMQAKQMELEYKARADQMEREMQAQVEAVRQQAQQQTDAQRMAMEERMEQMKSFYENQRRAEEMAFQREKLELEVAAKVEVANISSKAKVANSATETATAEISREVKP